MSINRRGIGEKKCISYLQGALAHVVLASINLPVHIIWRTEDRCHNPNSQADESSHTQSPALPCEHWAPHTKCPVQANYSQKKNTAEHIGILEEPIELAEENSKGPVIIEELLNQRGDACHAENQVSHSQVNQPHIGDICLQTESSHPDDYRVPCGAQEDGYGVKDNCNVVHNGIKVHCCFVIFGKEVGVVDRDERDIGGHSAQRQK